MRKGDSAFLKDMRTVLRGKRVDLTAELVRMTRIAVIVALVMTIIAVFFAVRAISLAGDQRVIHYTIERDAKTGALLSAQRTQPSVTTNDKWIMADLVQFVRNIRESSIDRATMLRNQQRAYAMIIPDSEGARDLAEWLKRDNIVERQKANREYVIPRTFRTRKIADNVYLLAWEEEVRDAGSNKVLRRDQLRGEFRIKTLPTTNPEVMERNPSATYIDDMQTDIVDSTRM